MSVLCVKSDITQFSMQKSVVTVNSFESELPRFGGWFKPWVIATSGMEPLHYLATINEYSHSVSTRTKQCCFSYTITIAKTTTLAVLHNIGNW